MNLTPTPNQKYNPVNQCCDKMNKIIITIIVDGPIATFFANDIEVAKVWRDKHFWYYQVYPTKNSDWSDRSQDSAIDDVKNIITRALNRWGITAEFKTVKFRVGDIVIAKTWIGEQFPQKIIKLEDGVASFERGTPAPVVDLVLYEPISQ